MRSSVLMIAIGSIGLAGCQSVGSSGAPPVTGSTTPAGAATSSVAHRARRDSRPRDSERRVRSAAFSAARSARH